MWYDERYKLIRTDYRPMTSAPPTYNTNPLTEIQDFNGGRSSSTLTPDYVYMYRYIQVYRLLSSFEGIAKLNLRGLDGCSQFKTILVSLRRRRALYKDN